MADLEQYLIELDSLLCKQTSEKLIELMAHLKMTTSTEGKSKFKLITAIRAHNEEACEGEMDQGVTPVDYVQDQIAFLTGDPPSLEGDLAEKAKQEKELQELQKRMDELKLKQEAELNELKLKLSKAKGETVDKEKGNSTELKTDKMETGVKSSKPALGLETERLEIKRDFKLSGQIGEAGQPGRLTYVAVIHEIELGLSKGYKETEIVEAIITGISPHSSLRNYLLTLQDRSLEKLRKILRVFFQEKTSAELYQDLVATCQQPKESVQQFLIRLLDCRNKVLFASREEGSQFEYSLKLVQNTFLKSLETGLRDKGLVTNLRPYLRAPTATDESLMRTVNDLACKQAERKSKLATATAQQRGVKVNSAQAGPEPAEHAATKWSKTKGDSEQSISDRLLVEMQAIKTDLNNLKSEVRNSQQAGRYRKPPRFNGPRGRQSAPPGCKECKSKGTMDCRHCFKCGEYGHVRRSCPNPEN